MRWWRRVRDWRQERRVKAWLVSPEGRKYLAEQSGGSVGGEGGISVSVAGMLGDLL